MKSFLIFFGIVLTVHFSINYYIFIRGWQALPKLSPIRPYYIGFFVLVGFTYIVGQFLESKAPSVISDALVWFGAMWMAFMVYFLFILALIDLVRLVNWIVPFYPQSVIANYEQVKYYVFLSVAGFVSIVVLLGYLNAARPQVRSQEITINKPNSEVSSLNIVAASDLHLGSIINRNRVANMVNAINTLNPDLILLPGDIIDGNLDPSIRSNLGDILAQLKSKYGVFAITGNHEYFGDVEKSCKYLNDHGVHVIRDSSVEVAGLTIVGREDRTAQRMKHETRASLEALMASVDKSRPVIMMDHQPFHLEEAEQNGVDLQLSGHTHYAQIWPLGYITDMVYEDAWGYLKKGNTHYYVSCGLGTWGPPVRIGSIAEVVQLKVHFSGN